VRVICATNAPLQDRVKTGAFRQDLYYRIKTVEINLPPLRERQEDIPALINHYLEFYTRRYHKSVEIGTLMNDLSRYPWPGNIRELQHAVERAVILCRGPVLTASDFQLVPVDPDLNHSIRSLNLNEVEKEIIRKALLQCNNNLTRTAEELGIGRTTLYRKMEEYGLHVFSK
jgi:DNA-binding NtrC family response regulator